MSPSSKQPTTPSRVPLPVRLLDMRELEERYLAASPEERMAMHARLAFFELVNDEERFALERRFPNELAGDPLAPRAPEGVRVSWDLRSRELIVCMLQYGERVLAASMDLVRTVGPTDDVAVFAMTATGSFLELGCPLPDGSRHFLYRASARKDYVREEGRVTLTEPVLLGNRVWLGTRRTMELLIVAAGPELPPYDETVPGTVLHGPTEDVSAAMSDQMRVGLTRFRVMVDIAENSAIPLRPSFYDRAAALASDLQHVAAPEGGLALSEVESFTTGSGSRYEVEDLGDTLDVVRHVAAGQAVQRLQNADIGAQSLVEGAPLVVFHGPAGAKRSVVFVFRLARIEPRG